MKRTDKTTSELVHFQLIYYHKLVMSAYLKAHLSFRKQIFKKQGIQSTDINQKSPRFGAPKRKKGGNI